MLPNIIVFENPVKTLITNIARPRKFKISVTRFAHNDSLSQSAIDILILVKRVLIRDYKDFQFAGERTVTTRWLGGLRLRFSLLFDWWQPTLARCAQRRWPQKVSNHRQNQGRNRHFSSVPKLSLGILRVPQVLQRYAVYSGARLLLLEVTFSRLSFEAQFRGGLRVWLESQTVQIEPDQYHSRFAHRYSRSCYFSQARRGEKSRGQENAGGPKGGSGADVSQFAYIFAQQVG